MSLISSHYCVVIPTSLKYISFWAHHGILNRAVSGWFSWLFIGCSKHLWGAAFFQYGSIDAKPSPASTFTMQATPYTQPNCAVWNVQAILYLWSLTTKPCRQALLWPYSLINYTQLYITQHITNTQTRQTKPWNWKQYDSTSHTLYPASHTAAPLRCKLCLK